MAKAFEAKYPGIAVRVERTGAERVFQRIGQEYASRIHAVDVVQSSDAAHFIVWKRDGILAPYVPEDVAKHYPAEHKDPDGMFATFRAWLCVIGYNTNLVKAEEAPKSYADLLEPKWTGKMVKAHPSYSGTIMTATFQMARDLGWEYFEKLAKQKVHAGAVVRRSAQEARARRARGDGGRQRVQHVPAQKEKGNPVEIVYPTEGAPLIIGPNARVQECAQSECGAAVPELLLLAGVRSSSSSTSAGCARSIRWPRRSRDDGRSPRSRR